jgi:hypothetical protein
VEHPVIGVWTVEVAFQGNPRREFATSAYHPDGSMTLTTSGYAAQGAWSAVSARSARVRAMAPLGPAEGQAGWHVLEAEVEVSQDGGSLSLQGLHSRPTPSGIPARTAITGSGQRLLVDGPRV